MIFSGKMVTETSAKKGIYKTATYLKDLGYRNSDLNKAIRRYQRAVPKLEDALVMNKFFFR